MEIGHLTNKQANWTRKAGSGSWHFKVSLTLCARRVTLLCHCSWASSSKWHQGGVENASESRLNLDAVMRKEILNTCSVFRWLSQTFQQIQYCIEAHSYAHVETLQLTACFMLSCCSMAISFVNPPCSSACFLCSSFKEFILWNKNPGQLQTTSIHLTLQVCATTFTKQ